MNTENTYNLLLRFYKNDMISKYLPCIIYNKCFCTLLQSTYNKIMYCKWIRVRIEISACQNFHNKIYFSLSNVCQQITL